MSKTGITRVILTPGETRPKGGTAWKRLTSLGDQKVETAALADSDNPPLSEDQLARLHRVSPVKLLRQRLGMTQVEFAQAYHLPVNTLRDWEQCRSRPDAPARALLLAIERDAETVRRLLSPAA